MKNMIEIRFSNSSLLMMKWIRSDLLSVELWSPGHEAGGALLLSGSTLLSGDELTNFLQALQPQPERAAA